MQFIVCTFYMQFIVCTFYMQFIVCQLYLNKAVLLGLKKIYKIPPVQISKHWTYWIKAYTKM